MSQATRALQAAFLADPPKTRGHARQWWLDNLPSAYWGGQQFFCQAPTVEGFMCDNYSGHGPDDMYCARHARAMEKAKKGRKRPPPM